jgi:FtsP/CotA-like multicopper oxidase with cupredoxin domain
LSVIPSGPPARVYSQTLSGGMHSPYWTINGRIYPNAERLAVQRGEWVRIHYWNHSMMPHPMHLHGHFFNVVNPSLPRDRWILKDTIIVDPMQRMEIEFLADNSGRWFHHCHNLYHMEAGMANEVTYQS